MNENRSPLPPLKALKAFEASARLRSFTRAADELHVTQGAVSQQVKLLENYLGTALFTRNHRKLKLTETARAYLPVLTEAFNNLQSSTNELFSKNHRTLLTVKCGSSFMQQRLIPKLPEFYELYPKIHIRLRSTVWPSVDEVEEADIEICNGIGDWTGMQVERLTWENYIVVGSPEFAERYDINNDAMKILQLPQISVLGELENWHHWFREHNLGNLTPVPTLESDTTTLAIDAARQGIGLLLGRDFNLKPTLDKGELVQVHPFSLKSTGAHYMVLPNKPLSPKVIAFRDWVKQTFQQKIEIVG